MTVDSSHIPFIAVSNSFVDLTRKHLKKCTFRFPLDRLTELKITDFYRLPDASDETQKSVSSP